MNNKLKMANGGGRAGSAGVPARGHRRDLVPSGCRGPRLEPTQPAVRDCYKLRDISGDFRRFPITFYKMMKGLVARGSKGWTFLKVPAARANNVAARHCPPSRRGACVRPSDAGLATAGLATKPGPAAQLLMNP